MDRDEVVRQLGEAYLAWRDVAEAQIRDGRPAPEVHAAHAKLETALLDVRAIDLADNFVMTIHVDQRPAIGTGEDGHG